MFLPKVDAPGKIICRWRYQELIIDIMTADTDILGFTNSWYKSGIEKSIIHQLPSEEKIYVFTASYFLASKIEAFNQRGNHNFYTSHDLEDIVLLLDGCPYLEKEIQQADTKVKSFIKQWVKTQLKDLIEISPSMLPPPSKNAGREQLLLSLIKRLAQ